MATKKQSQHSNGKLEVRINQLNKDKEIFISIRNGAALAKLFENNKSVASREQAIANAERLEKCWNMHDELIEALKNMTEIAFENLKNFRDDANYDKAIELLKQVEQE